MVYTVYNRRVKILVTGAHFTPAQAVIEELKTLEGVKIVYLGRKSTREGDPTPSAESEILPKMGIKFIPIFAGRLQRQLTIYTVPSLLKIPLGFIQSLYLLLREKPDVVLSFGGYVGVPVVLSAWLLSIPVIIHEQTLLPGLANRISSFFADKIAVTFKDGGFKGSKVVLTGNPLRKEIVNTDEERVSTDVKGIVKRAGRGRLPLVLILGGNQGSHAINLAVEEILPEFNQISCIVHQTGDSKFEDFERLKEGAEKLKDSERYLVQKWISGSDIGWLFKNADLIVCRAGMNTLLEGIFFAKPLIIIPLPVKEQEKNARYFEELGSAKVLRQRELSGEGLLKAIKERLEERESLEKRMEKAREILVPDASKRLALETYLLGKR